MRRSGQRRPPIVNLSPPRGGSADWPKGLSSGPLRALRWCSSGRFAGGWANRQLSGAAGGEKMKHESVEVEDGDDYVADVPVSAVLSVVRTNKYGSVPELEDEELADPDELERQVMLEQWGPVLQLPVRERGRWIRPEMDESGRVDWGAFATVDFERTKAPFDKHRCKVERLREELRDVLILFSVVEWRLSNAGHLVLKYLRKGIIELEHIVNDDVRELGRLWLRAERIQQQIREVRQARRRKVERSVLAVPG